VDLDRTVLALRIFLGLDRAGIGQLGMELEIELLARDFGGDHPLGGVGDLVLGEMPRLSGIAAASAALSSGTPSPVCALTK
jgi:hypothetical protein